jgi:REP element-mobilizing transposase RayT
VTFRLAGTIPKPLLRLYYAQKDWLKNETCRLAKLKLNDHSPEIQAHARRLADFQRHWFVKFEEVLHQAETGPTRLKDQTIAKIVADSLHYRDSKIYRLDAFSIMSNHVHVVFAPFVSERELREVMLPEGLAFFSRNPPLDAILKSLKGFTAWECNRALGRKGTFWQQESYDHVIRDSAEFQRIVRYVLNTRSKPDL